MVQWSTIENTMGKPGLCERFDITNTYMGHSDSDRIAKYGLVDSYSLAVSVGTGYQQTFDAIFFLLLM